MRDAEEVQQLFFVPFLSSLWVQVITAGFLDSRISCLAFLCCTCQVAEAPPVAVTKKHSYPCCRKDQCPLGPGGPGSLSKRRT